MTIANCEKCGIALTGEEVDVPQWQFESDEPPVHIAIMPTEQKLCEACTVQLGHEAIAHWWRDVNFDPDETRPSDAAWPAEIEFIHRVHDYAMWLRHHPDAKLTSETIAGILVDAVRLWKPYEDASWLDGDEG